ncbi:MAG: hypothetical protein RLZZ499_2562 [Cyanobacteriota bacterium]
MFSAIFEQFAEASSVTVMVRAIMEKAFSPEKLDLLFEQTAEKQYTKELLFSTLVSVMSLVVSGIHPSVSAAHKALGKAVGVSKPALYAKLNGLEVPISQALVRYSNEQLLPVIEELAVPQTEQLPGFALRIADGNHLAGTEHRLEVLREKRSGALPGLSIAVLDPQKMLVTDVFPCEDAHAQERSLFPTILETVQAKQVWIADRNFCTNAFLIGISQRDAYFLIREHKGLAWQELESLKKVGTSHTGEIFEQNIAIANDKGDMFTIRRVVIKLYNPTRHKDDEVVVLTNLPADVANAQLVCSLYLERWTVEKMFQVVTDVFSCELNTLGYPRAALFVFCVAIVAFNILSTLKSALKAVHGVNKVDSLSDFYIVEEVQATYRGMMIAIPPILWRPFEQMPVEQFAQTLKQLAAKVDLKRFSSSPRGVKKPRNREDYDPHHPHVSTARLLRENKNKCSP